MAAVAALASALAACAPSSAQVQGSPAPAEGPLTGGQTAAEKARADSARHPYTEADIRFMSTMIGHHAQAIEMAHLAPARAGGQSIRTLAARIINAQQDEIAIMQRWLRDRNQPVPELHVEGGTVMVHGGAHGGMMPGMLTAEQMRELAAATGPEFDRLFLVGMIQHHRGAVTMVQDLFSSWGAGQDETVFKFASDVNVDQSTEIARMEEMLATLILQRGTQ
jgi:uncharacterized protein (DUF305 family)